MTNSFFLSFLLSQADSASQFMGASRPDLAEKERREKDILERFLPSLLPQMEVDRVLKEILSEHPIDPGSDHRKALGKVFKLFYSRVDKAFVDTEMVKQRATVLAST
jgi:uncharacterized protein YqeY